MKYYDLHVEPNFSQGENILEEFLEIAQELGYAGIVFIFPWKKNTLDFLIAEIERLNDIFKAKPFLGFYVKSVREFKEAVKYRKFMDVLAVKGGDSRLNRLAVDKKEVDLLIHPEKGRKDSGLNHIFARLAAKNNTFIELNFHELIASTERFKVLKKFFDNVKLAMKYKFNIVVTSGAYSKWELRDPISFVALLHELGFDLKTSKQMLSKNIEKMLKENRKRRKKEWIAPGVEVVKWPSKKE